jgi:tRNA (cytidine32/uridine32-2'-O)-methyltransferase
MPQHKRNANIKIVMVATSHPGNIGAAARAMKAMGLTHLCLVAPKIFPHVEATARAAGADDILANAEVVPDLHSAIKDCQLIIGTSIRQRDLPLVLLDTRAAADKVVNEALLQQHQVAIVFGRESNGLSNEELLQCHYHMYIPSNPEFSSLNVAAAVQIVAYEIMMSRQATWNINSNINNNGSNKDKSGYNNSSDSNSDSGSSTNHDTNNSNLDDHPSYQPAPTKTQDLPATPAEMQFFYEHLEQVLVAINFLQTKKSKKLLPRLQRLFNRCRMEHLEVNILRGILTAIQKEITFKPDDQN